LVSAAWICRTGDFWLVSTSSARPDQLIRSADRIKGIPATKISKNLFCAFCDFFAAKKSVFICVNLWLNHFQEFFFADDFHTTAFARRPRRLRRILKNDFSLRVLRVLRAKMLRLELARKDLFFSGFRAIVVPWKLSLA
jgi:hypothetical protein